MRTIPANGRGVNQEMRGQLTNMLTDIQRRMLEAERFEIDGWCSAIGREAATDLLARGLVSCRKYGSDESQYTYLLCAITEAGRAALAKGVS